MRFDSSDLTGRHYRDVVRAGLIQVPEGRRVFPNLSVRENLELGSYARARARRAANLEQVLDTFPRLRERLGQLAGSMSGGEQQMLAIGRGLMAEPRLLILDEPSLGLSPLMVEELFALIARLHRAGLSILLVEQNVGQSLETGQRAYVLEEGAIRHSGSCAERWPATTCAAPIWGCSHGSCQSFRRLARRGPGGRGRGCRPADPGPEADRRRLRARDGGRGRDRHLPRRPGHVP